MGHLGRGVAAVDHRVAVHRGEAHGARDRMRDTGMHVIIIQMCQTKSKDRLRDPAIKVTTRDHATYPPTSLTYLYLDLYGC